MKGGGGEDVSGGTGACWQCVVHVSGHTSTLISDWVSNAGLGHHMP